nr:MAG TPA: hypothetical protein [Caudoviricetes sp.]
MPKRRLFVRICNRCILFIRNNCTFNAIMQTDDAIVSVRQQFCANKTFVRVFQRPSMKLNAEWLDCNRISRRNARSINPPNRTQLIFRVANVQFFPVNFNKSKTRILPNLNCILNIVCAHNSLKIENIDAEPFDTIHILHRSDCITSLF